MAAHNEEKDNTESNNTSIIIKQTERDLEVNREWLKIIYEEAWRQYVHEDEMAEQRDVKYLTILSVLISALGVIFSIFCSNFNEFDLSKNESYFILLGGIMIILLILGGHFVDSFSLGCGYRCGAGIHEDSI